VQRSAKPPRNKLHQKRKILSKKPDGKNEKPVNKRKTHGARPGMRAKRFESKSERRAWRSDWIDISRCSLSGARDFLLKRLLREWGVLPERCANGLARG
jgi:hypothetical protein